MSDDTPMAVGGTQEATTADQTTLNELNSIFDNVPFWANETSLEEGEARQRLKKKIEEDLQKRGKTCSERRFNNALVSEKYDRDRILHQVRENGDAPGLEARLLESIDIDDATLTEQWLSAWLRVKNAIPKCILDAVRQSNNDLKLADPTHPRRSVLNLLKEIRGYDPNGFRRLKYTSNIIHRNETEYAHYIGKANFRHGGNRGMVPKQVFINAPIRRGYLHDDRVHVYHEESGSGKTVELAASAFTRDALFTIMLDTDDVKLLASWNDDAVKEDRMNKSWTKLTSEVKSVLTRDETSLDRLVNFLKVLDGKMQEKTTLFIVVGIDEASKSPNFVRAIIQSHRDFGTDLGKFIQYRCTKKLMEKDILPLSGAPQGSSNASKPSLSFQESNNKLTDLERSGHLCPLKHIHIKVLFSVAGTGATQKPTGSIPKSFTHLNTSAKVNPADVYYILRSEYTQGGKPTIIPEYTEVKKFPLLKAIVDSNARMISIYMRVSRSQEDINRSNGKKSSENEYEQNAILSETFKVFMKSNGMKTLVHNPYLARLTASQALAVLLFQQNESFSKSLTNDQLNNMDYGITFQRFKGDAGDAIMHRLVVTYGLVTARPLRGDGSFKPQASPFALSDAMQLLCLWLIQGGEAIAAEKSFLGTTSASFETLTALLAGAAIAASSVVKKDKHGRVVAAPANGPNPNTVGQQEADIFAALRKVGMRIEKWVTTNNNMFSHYACGTTSKDSVVENGPGHLFWSLKGTHPALLPRGLGIARVHFHKSMMTCVETEADKQRIMDAAPNKPGAVFGKMDECHFDQNRDSRSSPLKDIDSDTTWTELTSDGSIFVDHDLLHQLSVLWEVEQQCNDQQDHKQKAPTVPQVTRRIPAAGINNSTNTSHKAPDEDAKPAAAASANTSQGTTTDVVKKTGVVELIFNLPLIHVAEGSSEFADAYITFLAQQTDNTGKKLYGLRTICIQAKDYSEDTSSDMNDNKKNASAVANPGLRDLFGKDLIYTVAGTKSTVAWNYGGKISYVPFVVDKSIILENQMGEMNKHRTKTAKPGVHAVIFSGRGQHRKPAKRNSSTSIASRQSKREKNNPKYSR